MQIYRLDPKLSKIVGKAEELARLTRHPLLDSRHLLHQMIKLYPDASKWLKQIGKRDPDKLAEYLLGQLSEEYGTHGAFPEPTSRYISVMRKAGELAATQKTKVINSQQLWQILLQEHGASLYQWDRQLEATNYALDKNTSVLLDWEEDAYLSTVESVGGRVAVKPIPSSMIDSPPPVPDTSPPVENPELAREADQPSTKQQPAFFTDATRAPSLEADTVMRRAGDKASLDHIKPLIFRSGFVPFEPPNRPLRPLVMTTPVVIFYTRRRLATAFKSFRQGNFTAADDIFTNVLRLLIPYFNGLEDQKGKGQPKWLEPVTMSHLDQIQSAIFSAIVGRWAVHYAQGDTLEAPPQIPEDINNYHELWDFILEVFVLLWDGSSIALDTILEYCQLFGLPKQANDIFKLISCANQSDHTLRIIHEIFNLFPDSHELGHQLCSKLLVRGYLHSAQQIATRLYTQDAEDLFAIDCLAYIAEQHKNWSDAYKYYLLLGDHLRAAYAATLNGDPAATRYMLDEVPATLQTTPLYFFCQGFLSYWSDNPAKAAELWANALESRTGSESDVEILSVLAKLDTLTQNALRDLTDIYVDRLPVPAKDALNWLIYWKSGEDRSSNAFKIISKFEQAATGSTEPEVAEYRPFLRAISATLTYTLMKDSSPSYSKYLRWMESSLAQKFKAFYLANSRQWGHALEAIACEEQGLAVKILTHALIDTAQHQQWSAASQLLNRHQNILSTSNRTVELMEELLLRQLWQKQDALACSRELTRWLVKSGQPDDVIPKDLEELEDDLDEYEILKYHHNAALAYGQLARTTNSDNAWRVMISHWAVVLSDTRYWHLWQKHRCQYYYGKTETDQQIKSIPRQIALRLAQQWDTLASDDSSGFTKEHAVLYKTMLASEWEVSAAISHLLACAAKKRVAIPSIAIRLRNPNLIKRYGFKPAMNQLVRRLPQIAPSSDAFDLLQTSSSDLFDVEILIESKLYDSAINALMSQPVSSTAAQKLLETACGRLVDDLINDGLYTEALEKVNALVGEMPQNSALKQLLVHTTLLWAEDAIEHGKPESLIEPLLKIKNEIKLAKGAQVDNLIANAYAAYGLNELKKGNHKHATTLLKESLRYDRKNPTARESLSHLLMEDAKVKFEKGALIESLESVKASINFKENSEAIALLVKVLSKIIRESADANRAGTEKLLAFLFTPRYWEENLITYTQLIIKLISVACESQQSDLAFWILQQLSKVPHEQHSIHVKATIAALLAQEGMKSAKNGNPSLAEEFWLSALRYDLYNWEAQHYLKISLLQGAE
jgi:hypothetical protein